SFPRPRNRNASFLMLARKSNQFRYLQGLRRQTRSLASRLRIPRPVLHVPVCGHEATTPSNRKQGEMNMRCEAKEVHMASTERVNRRASFQAVAVAALGAAVVGGIPVRAAAQTDRGLPQKTSRSEPHRGHLYMQTNETKNAIIHYYL